MNRILIISSSSRALADSADRAGFSFDVYDQFQDWDLQQICGRNPANQNQVLSATDFKSLVESIDGARYCGAVIGGGFENRLTELEILDTRINRFGPNIETLRRLQSPESLAELRGCTLMAGGKWPTTVSGSTAHLLSSGKTSRTEDAWLIKDLRGSGGSHVQRQSHVSLEKPDVERTISSSTVFQQLVTGQSISALYLSGHMKTTRASRSECTNGACQLIGCTEQLVGLPEFGASEFGYCGSVGPLVLEGEQQQIIARIGQNFAEQFAIAGVFGIDFILDTQGIIWPVDINPRITASAELFEIHRRINDFPPLSVFDSHIQACLGKMKAIETLSNGRMVAKGILFCREDSGLTITPEIFQQLLLYVHSLDSGRSFLRSEHSPYIADVPNPHTLIPFAAPILTLFEFGATHKEAKGKLLASANQLWAEIRA